MKLMREIRCFPSANDHDGPAVNRWAGSPGGDRFEMYWTLRAVVQGKVHPQTGYLCNIKDIDTLLTKIVAPRLYQRSSQSSHPPGIALAMQDIFPETVNQCPESVTLHSLELQISPYTRFMVVNGEENMVCLTRSFEFSAAHRLYCEEMSEEENRNIFGKCGNPHGHGHNYVVEVTVSGVPDNRTGNVIELSQFDRIVYEHVILRYDHKHLNIECPEFKELNPSVENIARTIWDRLYNAFDNTKLNNIRVWETPKTYADYHGE